MTQDPEVVVVNTVGLLGAYRPGELDELKRSFPDPDSRAVLTPGGHVLGGAEMAPAAAASQKLLTEIDSICLDAVLAVRRKLATANLLEFWGKLIAASSSASLVVLLLRAAGRPGVADKALALGIVAFVATALPLAVVTIRRGIGSGRTDLSTQYEQLRELSYEARRLRDEFNSTLDRRALQQLIKKTDEVARRAWSLLVDLGYDPRGAAGT